MSRKIDLTFLIEPGMMTFPRHWHPKVEVTPMGCHKVERRETRRLVLGTHTGTHCDAPRHFIPMGGTVDRLPLEVLIGPAVVLNFSKCQPLKEIGVKDLERHLRGKSPERLVLRFDWSDHWGKPRYYTDHPFLSEEAAHWLVERKVRLLAMDTPSPDHPANGFGAKRDAPNHRILLRAGVVLVEYLCGLKKLKKREVELIVLPLKILAGDGAPARCVAIES